MRRDLCIASKLLHCVDVRKLVVVEEKLRAGFRRLGAGLSVRLGLKLRDSTLNRCGESDEICLGALVGAIRYDVGESVRELGGESGIRPGRG